MNWPLDEPCATVVDAGTDSADEFVLARVTTAPPADAFPLSCTVPVPVLLATGVFMTWRVNKLPAAISFLGVYFLLFTVTAFVGDPAQVVTLFRAPDLHAALFFALFMVTDPPTSPARSRDQLVFGAITGVVGYAVFEWIGAAYFLLAGLLVANAWEAWHRAWAHDRRHEARLRQQQGRVRGALG